MSSTEPDISTTTPLNPSLLDKAVEGYDPEFQKKVLQLVKNTHLTETDPMYLMVTSMSVIQVLLKEAPNEIKSTFTYCHQEILSNLGAYEAAAAKGCEARIASSVDSLLKKTQVAKAQVTLTSCVLAGFLLVLTLSAGVVGGIAIKGWQVAKTPVDPEGKIQLTLAQAEAMKWALSPEGIFARNLIRWNPSLEGFACEKEAQTLGVTLKLGSKVATNGFCTVLVRPLNEVSFKEEKK